MAQTKRKRTNKHRGNAAGMVEARGRTSKPASKEERKKQGKEIAREARLNAQPTWSSAVKKSGAVAAIMFIALLIVGKGSGGQKLLDGVIFALLALVIYTPMSFYIETYLWRRRQQKKVRA